MKRRHDARRGRVLLPVFVACFVGGGIGWWLHGAPPLPREGTVVMQEAMHDSDELHPPAIVAAPTPELRVASADDAPPASPSEFVDLLRAKNLRLPLDGVKVETLRGQFGDRRDEGARGHEAVDLLAPRNTPIYAVDDGRIAKLFVSRLGGNTIYQFDRDQRVCYYYAHLERYADGLKEGQQVRAGDLLGYVGTSGNAPPNTPHLHFAISQLTPQHQWWKGTPIDPFLVYEGG